MTDTITDRSILVTGGAGFIGSHIVDALAGNNDVRVLDDFRSGSRATVPADVRLFEGDVGDRSLLDDAMDGVDLVFHEAAIVDVEETVRRPMGAHEVNATGTLSVLEAARREGARVVIASSAAVYGHPETTPITEDAPLRPASPYGVGKLAADRYATLYNELYGLETVALRYFNVYGPRGRGGSYSGVIDAFVRNVTAGEPLVVHGDGAQTRDFVHVRDVVRANLLAATTDNVGTAFNVGTGRGISVANLAALIRNLAGADVPIRHDDPRSGDVDHSVADLTRARAGLGFRPTIELGVGLRPLLDRELHA